MKKYGCYLAVIIYMSVVTNLSIGKPIKIDVDYARFKLDSEKNYLEVYYSIRRSDLTFIKTENAHFLAEAYVQFQIYKGDSLWLKQAWKVPSTVKDTSNIQISQNIIDVMRYEIEPGSYALTAIVQDLNQLTNVDSAKISFDVNDLNNSDVVLSDVQLATSIRKIKKDAKNVFYKNTMEVVPNPGSLFGAGLPMLYYYVEAYNLEPTFSVGQYKTLSFISNTENDTANLLLSRQQIKKRVGDTSVEVGAMNISSLQSGSYFFNFRILDMEDNQHASSSKKIYVYNPSVESPELQTVAIDSALARSPLSKMNVKEIDQEFEYAQYICSKEGKQFYEQLETLDAKQKFLFNFWIRRDPNPGSLMNEYRQNYLKRVAEATDRFKTLGREGWKTDMGRVYILYGEPDNREWFRSSALTKPYEVWNYYNMEDEGGVDFIFVDLSGFKQFRLIHSNKIGEVKNENWRLAIKEHAN